MASLEDVTVLLLHPEKDTVNKQDKKLCLKPACYHPRRVRNKGALLVLAWNFLTMSVFYLINDYLSDRYLLKVCLGVFGLTLLIAGWLADTHIGRYNVMHSGIWIMWIATLITTTSSVVASLHGSYDAVHPILLQIAIPVMAVGLGGFQASIIQFGLDQLHDASTSEIKSFIIWFVWTAHCQGIPMDFTFVCLKEGHRIFMLLYVFANLSSAMILVYIYNHCLIKEPIQQNPLKLVCKVIRYAIKNKYPRQRSAFTYCEDELPPRIDFGKSKYGGPFTTEQVEDVKTFFRFLPVAMVAGMLCESVLTSNVIRDSMYKQFTEISQSAMHLDDYLTKCSYEASFTHTTYYGAVFLILFHEVFIYPIFYRCMVSPHRKSTQNVSGHGSTYSNSVDFDDIQCYLKAQLPEN